MAFTREWLLLKYDIGLPTVYMAVEIMAEPYEGGVELVFQQAKRNTSGTLVRVLETTTKRAFSGFAALSSRWNGTTDVVNYDAQDYIKATPAQIRGLWLKTDLEVKSFEDDAFWEAAILNNWNARVVYDPWGIERACELVMEEI